MSICALKWGVQCPARRSRVYSRLSQISKNKRARKIFTIKQKLCKMCYIEKKDMDITEFNFWGRTKFWWVFMVVGILFIPLGLWIIFSPVIGYEVVSILLGWALLIYGIVQLLMSSDAKRYKHTWGWWLAGGIIDIFVGFILLSNIALSELILPFFFAFIFLYKGVNNIVSSISIREINRSWWLYLLNGILMLLISFMFFFVPYMSSYVVLFLSALAFVYWGLSLIAFSFELKPIKSSIE
jgi:uncharacterized membrane protein HdeD (DUF308 family)